MDPTDLIIVFAASVIAVVLLDLLRRSRQPKSHEPAFPCFYCKKHTSRRDGYCSDEHRDEDLRTVGFERDFDPSQPLD